MNVYLVYSGSQEDEDGVRGIYDSYSDACDNARKLMDKNFKTKFRCVDTNYLLRWESENSYYHVYIDEEVLNRSVLD